VQWLELGSIDRAVDLLGEADRQTVWFDAVRAQILYRSGQWHEAAALFESVLDRTRRVVGDRLNWCMRSCWVAPLHRAMGNHGRAEQIAADIRTIAAEGGNAVLEAMGCVELARICAATRRPAEARTYVARARGLLTEDEDWRVLGGRLALADAVTTTAEGSIASAAALFEQAVAIARRYTVPWVEAEALHEWGRALLAARAWAPAAEKFDSAVEIYRRIGAGDRWVEGVLADRARGEAERHTGRRGVAGSSLPAYPAGLSEREVEVLRLIAAGKSNREIAGELVISSNTVANHVTSIFNKTGAANRAEAAAYATRHGLTAS
jgi:DNA-binding CsgD family transcriptional regulator